MKTTRELEHKIRVSKDASVLADADFNMPELSGYLRELLRERGLTAGEAIRRCNLDRSYGYQLFNGTRRPTRDMLLVLSFQLRLGEQQAQRLLKLAGRPVLYARNRRDAALLYGLGHRLTLAQAEELLASLEEVPLGPDV
ncbi:MAG: helix-turn-helix domain-containing protein [Oscillospiraceae bacterium]|nr:helix-turn-helix domain-containing protein [Oscillospiraceae bacterium]